MRALRAFSTAFLLLSLMVPVPASAVSSSNPTPDCSAGTTCTITFTYIGDYYSWVVPSGVTSLTFDLRGARGGNGVFPSCTNTSVGSAGGGGGKVTGTLSVTSGSTLYFYVGGRGEDGITMRTTGGWNGGGGAGYYGGNAVSSPCYPGTGGGASDIRTSVGTLSSRLVVAGGGGGAGGYTPALGGHGGGLTGANGGAPSFPGGQGLGGTQSAGGAAGTTCGGAGAGSLGTGGNGAGCSHGGGGGGGGYYGGGGGIIEPGGGGSSYTSPTLVTGAVHTQGSHNNDGQISITYQNTPQPTTFSTSQTSPTNISTSGTISYSLVLSQSVSDLAAADFQFGGTSTCNTPGLSGSGTTYTVTATNCTEGSLILQLKANSVTGTSTGPPSVSSANTVIIDRTSPTVASVTAPANKTYIPSETPTFIVVFSESVTVTGTPRIALTVGSLSKYANFVSMSDSKTALFRYTIATAVGEFDTDGIAIASTTLDLNGGSIADLATNALSPATFTAPTLTSVLVAQRASAPTISSITATSTQLDINFTAGASNGATITTYQYSTNNGSSWNNRATGTTASPLTITGLSNGTAYVVRIRAISIAGNGDSSTAVTETPTAVSVSGDTTLTITYGGSASTGAYSATGGTGSYSWSLGSSLTGISLSGTTVTAGSTTPAGTYTQTVRATDGNSQVGTKTLTITVNKAMTSITIALPNSAVNAALGAAVTITATVPRAGSVNFKLGGTTISGCGAAAAASTSATCAWTPGALGSVSLTAVFTPTDTSNYETSTTTLSITVVNGVSTVSLSLTGGVIQVPKGQTINIIAAIDQAGKVTFLIDGKRLPGCINKSGSAGNVTCSWKPSIQKMVTITATLNPTNSVYNNSSSRLAVWVIRRSGYR